MIRVVLKPSMVVPQAVATKRMNVEATRTGRRPNMFASGTQKILLNPSNRTLNWAASSAKWEEDDRQRETRYRNEPHQVLDRSGIMGE
jgi:hypothetical protein